MRTTPTDRARYICSVPLLWSRVSLILTFSLLSRPPRFARFPLQVRFQSKINMPCVDQATGRVCCCSCLPRPVLFWALIIKYSMDLICRVTPTGGSEQARYFAELEQDAPHSARVLRTSRCHACIVKAAPAERRLGLLLSDYECHFPQCVVVICSSLFLRPISASACRIRFEILYKRMILISML